MSFAKMSLDTPDEPQQRRFLQRGSLGVLSLAVARDLFSVPAAAASPQQAEKKKRIVKAQIGNAILLPNNGGDVWTTTWADDDNLYSASDDTGGFDNACDSNLAVNRISGGPPPNVVGVTVNPMKQFGKAGELKEDGASWKASGLICVNGVLYLAVSRHRYSDEHFVIQETWDASIVKSTDHGMTWSPTPKLGHAMFPGRVFSNPFFVQHGKDGHGMKAGTENFVYAVSNDGTWNNGNWMTLGRVSAGLIERLDPEDWEFVHGFDDRGQPIWRPRHDNALYIFRSPGRASMTGIHYIARLDLYIMPQWHYPRLDDPKRRWQVTRWEFYSAPALWGPWTLFHTQDFEPQGFYNPSIPSKFISEGGRQFWIFVAGGDKFYGLNVLPVTLEIETT
jgi:hypothetical protein